MQSRLGIYRRFRGTDVIVEEAQHKIQKEKKATKEEKHPAYFSALCAQNPQAPSQQKAPTMVKVLVRFVDIVLRLKSVNHQAYCEPKSAEMFMHTWA